MISSYIRFARNICRIVYIPVALSGTNSRINNLVGKLDSQLSGFTGKHPWVKVITSVPRANLKTIGYSVKCNALDEKNEMKTFKLAEFIKDDVVKYDELLLKLIGFSTTSEDYQQKLDAEYIVNLLKFLIDEQAPTSLPGLIIGAIQFIINELANYKTSKFDLKTLWENTVREGVELISGRKANVLQKFGLFTSAHILTFPTEFKNEYDRMDGCARAVNDHFFSYGPPNLPIFDLYQILVENNIKFSLEPNGLVFEDPVFFPSLNDDFFLNITCLNAIFKRSDYTVASLHEGFLKNWYTFKIQSHSKVPDSFAFELLAHWCICYAGHVNVNGKTKASDAIDFFLKNIQVVEFGTLSKFEEFSAPTSLKTFLNDIEIPYLFTNTTQSSAIAKRVSKFISMGNSYRPPNMIGWDVVFEAKIGSDLKKCLIECKLWSRPVGIATFFKYYRKACISGIPISILVVKSIQKSLQTPVALLSKDEMIEDEEIEEIGEIENIYNYNLFKDIPDPENDLSDPEDEIYQDEEKEQERDTKAAKITINYAEELQKLWNGQINDNNNANNNDNDNTNSNTATKSYINIYTVTFNSNNFTFTWKALKEFDNPTGVFIITDSNFNPALISSKSHKQIKNNAYD